MRNNRLLMSVKFLAVEKAPNKKISLNKCFRLKKKESKMIKIVQLIKYKK